MYDLELNQEDYDYVFVSLDMLKKLMKERDVLANENAKLNADINILKIYHQKKENMLIKCIDRLKEENHKLKNINQIDKLS